MVAQFYACQIVEKHMHITTYTTLYFEKDLKFGVEDVNVGRIIICKELKMMIEFVCVCAHVHTRLCLAYF